MLYSKMISQLNAFTRSRLLLDHRIDNMVEPPFSRNSNHSDIGETLTLTIMFYFRFKWIFIINTHIYFEFLYAQNDFLIESTFC